jgi:quercetin dioxygenase-like cupin family protein
MENLEVAKSKPFDVTEFLVYASASLVTKVLIKKVTGNVIAVADDTGKTHNEKTSPFDTLIQIVDGCAEIVIDQRSHVLEAGQSIIIPAHARSSMTARPRFKMLATTIKSGYEE